MLGGMGQHRGHRPCTSNPRSSGGALMAPGESRRAPGLHSQIAGSPSLYLRPAGAAWARCWRNGRVLLSPGCAGQGQLPPRPLGCAAASGTAPDEALGENRGCGGAASAGGLGLFHRSQLPGLDQLQRMSSSFVSRSLSEERPVTALWGEQQQPPPRFPSSLAPPSSPSRLLCSL